jgi:predicted RNase H-like HicB family nuclease
MKTYRARFRRDERGVWIVDVPAIRGCHSYGRSLDEARRNIREALGLFVRGAAGAHLGEDVQLDRRVKVAVTSARAARRRAEAEEQAAQKELRRAARFLTKEVRLSLRDAGDLLGLSRQRIQQLSTATEQD